MDRFGARPVTPADLPIPADWLALSAEAIRACETAGFQGGRPRPDEYAIMARVMTRHR